MQKREGKEVLCTRLQAGEFFGEMAILNGGVRSSTVRCKRAMDALSLPKREFGLLTANLPELKKSFEQVKHQRIERDEATEAAPPTVSLRHLRVFAGATAASTDGAPVAPAAAAPAAAPSMGSGHQAGSETELMGRGPGIHVAPHGPTYGYPQWHRERMPVFD